MHTLLGPALPRQKHLGNLVDGGTEGHAAASAREKLCMPTCSKFLVMAWHHSKRIFLSPSMAAPGPFFFSQ